MEYIDPSDVVSYCLVFVNKLRGINTLTCSGCYCRGFSLTDLSRLTSPKTWFNSKCHIELACTCSVVFTKPSTLISYFRIYYVFKIEAGFHSVKSFLILLDYSSIESFIKFVLKCIFIGQKQ